VLVRVKLILAYDGTHFHGFARQPGLRTVQGVLEEAICRACGLQVEVQGASRTDAGVHARRQIAHVDLDDDVFNIPFERIAYALRRQLPQDVALLAATRAPEGFHARHGAKQKTYRYTFRTSAAQDVFLVRFETQVHKPLNVAAMQDAAVSLIGKHDFSSFCFARAQQDSKVRTLDAIRVLRTEEETVFIEVTGRSFLHNMVRIIAGTLLEVGKGRLKASDMARILAQRDRRAAGPTAPPQGLTLWDIEYTNDRDS